MTARPLSGRAKPTTPSRSHPRSAPIRPCMFCLHLSINLQYEVLNHPADFIFNLQAARTAHQDVLSEALILNQAVAIAFHEDLRLHHRTARLRASPGMLTVHYRAEVMLRHHRARAEDLAEAPLLQLPPEVLTYLFPSRYCESDRLQAQAHQLFGHLPPGYARAEAICAWVQQHVRFTPGSSHGSTSALDTLAQRQGVCRDFAHLMIALCRALNLPARICSGLDYGADPDLGPTDFHAYVEVYLGGRWYLFDPSGTAIPEGLLRIGTGRDAADVAFATIFGQIRCERPQLTVSAVVDPARGLALPRRGTGPLSTDG